MTERKTRKTGTSRKGKKRLNVETRLKATAHPGKALEKSPSYFEAVMSTMREPLLVLDADFRVVSANRALYEAYGAKRDDVEGKVLFELGDKAWDLPMLRERLGEVLTEGKVIDGFLVEHDFPVIGQRALLVNASPMIKGAGQRNRIVVTFNDITELRRADEEIKSLSRFPSENPNVVMRISKDGHIQYSNRAGQAILGEWKCQVGQSVPAKWHQLVSDVLESGAKKEVEEEHCDRTFLMMFAPIVDAGYVNVYGRDITERKKAEEELRKASDELETRVQERTRALSQVSEKLQAASLYSRSLIEASLDPLVTINAQGKITDVNKATEEATGFSREQLIGTDFSNYFTDPEEARRGYMHVFAEGFVRDYPLAIHHRSGKVTDVLYNATVYRNEAGGTQGVFAAARDVTQRKLAEETVRAERKRFVDVMEKLPAYLILLTPDYHVSYANRFFRERFGEDKSRRCFEYLFGRSEPCDRCETYKSLEKMAPLEWEWIGPDGRNYYIYDSPFTDVDGSTLIMEVGIDITERKKAEQALKNAHDELEMRVDERTKELTKASEALREREIDLNRAQAVAKVGSWRLDVQRNRLLWSDETYDIFGIPKGTPLTYETFVGNVHSEDREFVDQKWQAAVCGEPYDIEHRIVANGEIKWVREKAELEFDKDNVLLGGFGTVQDITERKKAEEELRETTDYLDSLLNYANAPIIVWDPKFRISKFNHAFEHLAGYKAEEVLGKHLSVLFPEKSREESLTEIQHTLAGEQWEVVEIPILRKDGNVRIVLWNSANIHAADGKTLMATIAQGQDITERKQLEEKLFQSERKYRSLYETSLDGIVSVDMGGRITECNDAYAQMLGYSKDELKDMTYVQLTPEKWHQMEQEIVTEQVTKRGHSDIYEKEYIRKDGSIMPISIRTWLVRDEKWMPIGMWSIVRDITRTKLLENELKRYSEHLEHLVEERTRELKDAERLAAIGETAAMVGHDIRNPLQTVEGAVFLAKEEIKALPSRSQEINNIEEMLNAIHEETTYVNKIVSDLQDYARPLSPQLEEADTKQLINSTLGTVKIPSAVEVSATVNQDCGTMIVDPTMMKRVLANLITNALQAMPDGGKLTITAFKKQDEVYISVQDTGQGISDENRAKVFQPLFSTKAKGQGFGLAVVKRLVEAHNGTIAFESEVGKGTTFTITIPVAKEAA